MRYDASNVLHRGDRVRYIASTYSMRGKVGTITAIWSYSECRVRWDGEADHYRRVRNTSLAKIPETLTTHETWART